MTKLKVMIGINTLSKIKLLSAVWNKSIDSTVRFMLTHYLKFGITGVNANRFEPEDRDSEKDNLIKILQEATAEKDKLINYQSSELVFAHRKIMNRELVIETVKELVLNAIT